LNSRFTAHPEAQRNKADFTICTRQAQRASGHAVARWSVESSH
jgi:hypothetical protein